MPDVKIIEVGPRDGLQPIAEWVPTETKLLMIGSLLSSGIRQIEVGSFVSPKAVPQMRDTPELIEALNGVGNLTRTVLTPNAKGAQLALQSGAEQIVYFFSASEAHNQANVRRSVSQSLEEAKTLLQEIPQDTGADFRVNIATSFHCPFDGFVDEKKVIGLVEDLVSLRPTIEIGICDTTGRALPTHVTRLFETLFENFDPSVRWTFHCHDTYGLGVANVLAAYEAGVRRFDTSIAGLGGCPFAPGATGNVATEDVVFLFEELGIKTGIDLARLLEACELVEDMIPGQLGGHIRMIKPERLLC